MNKIINLPKDEVLEFSYNWNKKLHCIYFTTIRKPSKKYVNGNRLKVCVKGIYHFNAEVVDVKIVMAQNLPDWTCYLDTGYDKPKTLEILYKMYQNKYDLNIEPLAIVLLKNLEP